MLRRNMEEADKLDRKEEGQRTKEKQRENICPTCYNQKYGGIYCDENPRMIYEDEKVKCFLEKYPRTEGHTIILVKEHYEDITELPDSECEHIMKIITKISKALKKVLNAEKVYICTMCDGGRNHLHFQAIPRLKENITGSKLFVNERGVLVLDEEKLEELRKELN